MIRPGWKTVRRVLKLSSVTRRPRRVVGSTPTLPTKRDKLLCMPIYLDGPDNREPATFTASLITEAVGAMDVKPEAICLECGNAAATHRWTGLQFTCPGQPTPDMALAEQYAAENLDAEVRKSPAIQRLIASMAAALQRGERARAEVISKLMLEEQYRIARAKNVIDKRITKSDYAEYYFELRGARPTPRIANVQEVLNSLESQINDVVERKTWEQPDTPKPKTRGRGPDFKRPKRTYGDDY